MCPHAKVVWDTVGSLHRAQTAAGIWSEIVELLHKLRVLAGKFPSHWMLAVMCLLTLEQPQRSHDEEEEERAYEESPVYPDLDEFTDVVVSEESKVFQMWNPFSKILCVVLVAMLVLFSGLTISAIRVALLKRRLQMD